MMKSTLSNCSAQCLFCYVRANNEYSLQVRINTKTGHLITCYKKYLISFLRLVSPTAT